MKCAKRVTEGVELRIRVIPRSSKSSIVGEHNNELKIKLTSPPVYGAANKEVLKLLSKVCGHAKSRIEIVRGLKDRSKIVLLRGLDIRTFASKLKQHFE